MKPYKGDIEQLILDVSLSKGLMLRRLRRQEIVVHL